VRTAPKAIVAKALNDYLDNVKLENCRVKGGYLSALGLIRVMADVGSDKQAEAQE
jgi:hypothetical protein